MAVELSKCIGRSATTPPTADTFGLRTVNVLPSVCKWPPYFGLGQVAGQVVVYEAFFYRREVVSASRSVIQTLCSFVNPTLKIETAASSGLRVFYTLGGSSTRYSLSFQAGAWPIDEWMHLVLRVESAGLVQAYLGRVGKKYDYSASTEDTFPYGQGGNGGSTVIARPGGTATGFWGLGWVNNSAGNYGGVGTTSSSGFNFLDLVGGVSTFRAWKANPGNAYIEANKDDFLVYSGVDATRQHLLVEWRFNESGATDGEQFDDSGLNEAVWDQLLGGSSFDSHPFAPQATNFDLDLGDSAAVSDAISIARERSVSLEDSASVTDAGVFVHGHARTLSDSVPVTDSSVVLHAHLREYEDGVAVSDSIQVQVERGLEDSTSVEDSLVLTATYERALLDLAGVSDAIAVSQGHAVDLEDASAVSDALAIEVIYGRALEDSVDASDALTLSQGHGRALEDSVATEDAIAVSQGHGRALEDSVTAEDSISIAVNYVRSFVETVPIGDSLVVDTTGSFIRNFEEGVVPDDSISITATYDRALEDAVAVADAISIAQERSIGLEDVVTVGDSIQVQHSSGAVNYEIELGDSVAVSDAVEVAREIALAFEDFVYPADSIMRAVAWGRPFEEEIAVADAIVGAVIKEIALEDEVEVSDSISIQLQQGPGTYVFNFEDTVAVADSIQHASTFERALAFTIGVGDAIRVSHGKVVNLSDSVAVSDSHRKEISKSFSELPFGVSDILSKSLESVHSDAVDVIDGVKLDRYDFEDQVAVSDSIFIQFQSADIKPLAILGGNSTLAIIGRSSQSSQIQAKVSTLSIEGESSTMSPEG